jgi:hypothetical protein
MQYLNTNYYRYEEIIHWHILVGTSYFAQMQYVCTCDMLSPDLCSYYFGSGDNDTDVVVSPLFHITDSQHSSSHSLQEWLLHWDQLEASKPAII